MSFLLDTNVLSEVTRPRPAPAVLGWLRRIDEDATYVSVATFAELRYGIERMPAGRRRDAFASWLDTDLLPRFAGRIVALELGIAETWAQVMARAARAGRAVSAMDGWLAATALHHGLTLVTRDVADEALTRLEIDRLGLDAMDRRYLTMIATTYKGGPVGVETLAAGLAEPRDTIEDVVEPYLIQLGLIARTARGRVLNDGGWAHLEMVPPAPPAPSQGGLFSEDG